MNQLVDEKNRSISCVREENDNTSSRVHRGYKAYESYDSNYAQSQLGDAADNLNDGSPTRGVQTFCGPCVAIRTCQTGDIIKVRGDEDSIEAKQNINDFEAKDASTATTSKEDDYNTRARDVPAPRQEQRSQPLREPRKLVNNGYVSSQGGRLPEQQVLDPFYKGRELTSQISEFPSCMKDRVDGKVDDSVRLISHQGNGKPITSFSPTSTTSRFATENTDSNITNQPSTRSFQKVENPRRVTLPKGLAPMNQFMIVGVVPNATSNPSSHLPVVSAHHQDDNSTIASYGSIVNVGSPGGQHLKDSLDVSDVEQQQVSSRSSGGDMIQDPQNNNKVIIEYPDDFMSHRSYHSAISSSANRRRLQERQQQRHTMRRPESPKYEERTRHDDIFCFGKHGRFVFIMTIVGLITVLILVKQQKE